MQFPELSRSSCKTKKTFFGPEININCPLGQDKRVNRHSHIAYTLYLHFSSLYKFLCKAVSRYLFYPEDTTTFFGSRPNWFHFGRFEGNNSCKKRQIKLKFRTWLVLIVEQMSYLVLWKTQIFTHTGHTQSLHFWCNFDSNLPLKMAKLQKSKY